MNEIKFEIQQSAGAISTNFDEIRKGIDLIVKEYEGALFTEESKAFAKKQVAYLRALKKDITGSCKAVKEKYMQPYTEFEAQVKAMASQLDVPIGLIDRQIKEMEEQRVLKKQEEIQALYDGIIGEMLPYAPYAKIYNPKWENATVSMSAVKKEMVASIQVIYDVVNALKSNPSEYAAEALTLYVSGEKSFSEAITHINNLEAQKARILQREAEKRARKEERRRQLEIERARAEERQRVADEERIRQEAGAAAMKQVASVDEGRAAELALPDSHTAVYTVVGTDDELRELEMAMISLGLYYERKDS